MIYGDGGHASVIRDFFDGFHGCICAVGDNAVRKREVTRLEAEGWRWGKAIHPTAYVARNVIIEPGAVIMAHAVIQSHSLIGAHAIVNTGATVDHHCVIEPFAHIAPGAHLCGNVRVGEGALVGVGVGVAPGARIPAWHLVKAHRIEIEPISGH